MQIDLNDLPIPMRCPKCGAGMAPTMAQIAAEGLACPCGWRFTLEDAGIEASDVAEAADDAIRRARGI